MPEETKIEPLSDFWRKSRSSVPEEELANVLHGAQGYIGFFGSDFGIGWGQRSTTDQEKNRVELDYSPLTDKQAPFDGKHVDIVMGTAIHECGHIKWSYPSVNVKEYYAKKKGRYFKKGQAPPLYGDEHREFSELFTVANIIEDFYVENKISEKLPTLGAYLREARKLASKSDIPHNIVYDLSTDNPSYDSLVTMWGAICLIDKTIPDTASATSKKLLNKLINYTMQAAKSTEKNRLRIAYSIWSELQYLARAQQKERERQAKKAEAERQERQKAEQEQAPKQEEQTSSSDESSASQEPGQEPSGEKEESDEKGSEPEGQGEEKEQEEETGQGEQEESSEETRDFEPDISEEAQEPKEAGKEGTEEESPEDTSDDSDEEDGSGEGKPAPSEESIEQETELKPEDTKVEEDLNEPYQSHESLRDCYSINLGDKQSMPKDMKDTVDAYLEMKPENISQQVNEILGAPAGSDRVILELAGSDPVQAHKLEQETRKMAQKISQLFMFDKKMRTRFSRGLYEGNVDPRRLYRAGASEYKLFQQREVLNAPSLAVGVLVDASSSMASSGYAFGSETSNEGKLKQAMAIAAAIKTALSIVEGVDLMVVAYNTQPGHSERIYSYQPYEAGTYLHRVYDKKTNEFRPIVYANGGTPSGRAIAGMVSQIGRYLKGKDKMIIHVTDGCPNNHEEVKKAVDYCKEHRIEVMTLTLQQFTDSVIESYHGLCEYVPSMDKVPEAISNLLKKRLQKRMMRIK